MKSNLHTKPRGLRRCWRRWLDKVFWSMELKRRGLQVWQLEWDLRQAKYELRAVEECYRNNQSELVDAKRLIKVLRLRLSEAGKAERLRKPKLP